MMNNQKLTDNSPMPFGKYKGTALANVPAHYLLWLYFNKKANGAVMDYIEDNLSVLHAENSKNEKPYP